MPWNWKTLSWSNLKSVEGTCAETAVYCALTWHRMTGEQVRIVSGMGRGRFHSQAQALNEDTGEWEGLRIVVDDQRVAYPPRVERGMMQHFRRPDKLKVEELPDFVEHQLFMDKKTREQRARMKK